MQENQLNCNKMNQANWTNLVGNKTIESIDVHKHAVRHFLVDNSGQNQSRLQKNKKY